MKAADKIAVIEPIDSLVVYGNDGRCYSTQGCSILGLLEFRRWNKAFLGEVEKVSQMVEAEPLFRNAKFLDFYSLSLTWQDGGAFLDIFPYWVDWAEEEAELNGLSGDAFDSFCDEKLGEYLDSVQNCCEEFGFNGPTLALSCNQMLILNGLDPAVLPPKTLYQLLFDHVGADGNLHPGKLIALNRPETYKRPTPPGAPEPQEPPSEIDPIYQSIAGLVSLTDDIEKALSVAQNFPAKLVNGVGAALAEQQERQRAKSNPSAPAPARKLTPDEVQDVLSGFNAPI